MIIIGTIFTFRGNNDRPNRPLSDPTESRSSAELQFEPNGKWAPGCVYIQVISRGNNAEGANRRSRAVPVHLTRIQNIPWAMLRAYLRLFAEPRSTPNISIRNIPFDWIVHPTPYGYMDRDGWLKDVTQFSNICSTSLLKPALKWLLLF